MAGLRQYELFVIIEKNECKIYGMKKYNDEKFKLKDYREIQTERSSVKEILSITYKNIRQFAKIEEQCIDRNTVEMLATSLNTHSLDVFDRTLVDFCNNYGIDNIVTDDKDYRTALDRINIYTANQSYFRK